MTALKQNPFLCHCEVPVALGPDIGNGLPSTEQEQKEGQERALGATELHQAWQEPSPSQSGGSRSV